jgi:plastocyanin
MVRRVRIVATLAILGLVGSLLVAPLEAGAAPTDYTIKLGSSKLFQLAAPAPALGTRFYSPALKVHKGDTIKFKGTAGLAPANVRIKKWIGNNTRGVGNKWSIAVRDKDEPKQHFKFNNRVIFNAQQGCGYGAKPCGYDGSHVVANGFFFGRPKFVVKINADVGDVFWALNLVQPRARLRIEVVDKGAAATKQSAIDSYKERQLKLDAARALAAHNRLLNYNRVTRDSSGTLVRHALAGYDGKGFALFSMYPRKTNIHKGQKVRWHFSSLRYEDHTVSLPGGKAAAVSQKGTNPPPLCDTGKGPDKPPQIQGPPFCNNPGDLEFDIPPKFAFKRGNKSYVRGDYTSSGLEGANINVGAAPYTLKFTRTKPSGFNYLCLIHSFMKAKVSVRPKA